jgi:hypothetical protein
MPAKIGEEVGMQTLFCGIPCLRLLPLVCDEQGRADSETVEDGA